MCSFKTREAQPSRDNYRPRKNWYRNNERKAQKDKMRNLFRFFFVRDKKNRKKGDKDKAKTFNKNKQKDMKRQTKKAKCWNLKV
jgi:hypothetical protein